MDDGVVFLGLHGRLLVGVWVEDLEAGSGTEEQRRRADVCVCAVAEPGGVLLRLAAGGI